MLLLEEGPGAGLLPICGLGAVPVVGELFRRDRDLFIQVGPNRPEAFPNLFFENPHEAVCAVGRTHAAERKRHGEHSNFGERMGIGLPEIVVPNGVPERFITPNEQVDQCTQKMGFPGAVLRLNPETLSLAMNGAFEDHLEMSPQGGREQIILNRLRGVRI